MEEGPRWWRGHHKKYPPTELVPEGVGDTRFAPLPDARHIYMGATRTVALLESALHEAAGPDPTIYLSELVDSRMSAVGLTAPVQVADLRDPELDRLGIQRTQLVDTTPRHYECTRRWGEAIRRSGSGGNTVEGAVWHSRQADLHARANLGGVFSDVVKHGPAEVAVLWHTQGRPAPLVDLGNSMALVIDGRPARLLLELSELLRIPLFS